VRLVAGGCRFVLGPYGSDLVRAVAHECVEAVVWNHGAAADDVQRLPGVVSVSSPASSYLVALGRTVAELRPNAAVCVLTAAGRFPSLARDGLERAAPELGLRLVADPTHADAVLLCGPLGWEIERIRRWRRSGLVIGAVSPGLASFPTLLGTDPEGLLAPVQWHPDLPVRTSLGPKSVHLSDYVAAQAYASVLVANHCLQRDPDPLTAAKQLRAVTFFGGFQLAADGLQVGHQLAVISWRNHQQQLLSPAAAA
jgi:hypothetical protein